LLPTLHTRANRIRLDPTDSTTGTQARPKQACRNPGMDGEQNFNAEWEERRG